MFRTLLKWLVTRDSRVESSDRRVASILRQAASSRPTSSLASLMVCLSVLTRRICRLVPVWVDRYRARVPPILVLVPSSVRRNVSPALLRRVPVTPMWVWPVPVPKTGRRSDVVVDYSTPLGLPTFTLSPPAYLSALSSATAGQRVECVLSAVQQDRTSEHLVSWTLGWPESTRMGMFIARLLGSCRFLSWLCLTRRGFLVSSA